MKVANMNPLFDFTCTHSVSLVYFQSRDHLPLLNLSLRSFSSLRPTAALPPVPPCLGGLSVYFNGKEEV